PLRGGELQPPDVAPGHAGQLLGRPGRLAAVLGARAGAAVGALRLAHPAPLPLARPGDGRNARADPAVLPRHPDAHRQPVRTRPGRSARRPGAEPDPARHRDAYPPAAAAIWLHEL